MKETVQDPAGILGGCSGVLSMVLAPLPFILLVTSYLPAEVVSVCSLISHESPKGSASCTDSSL